MTELSLLQRLRQRRVFRSMGYYILGGWLLLQVGDVIVEPAGLPAWSMTALLYLLLMGFPAAVFLGWRYDVTEHGLVRTTASTEADFDAQTTRLRWTDYAIISAMAGIIGAAAYQMLPLAQQSEPPAVDTLPANEDVAPQSIAVLPFADLSQQGDQQFLGDGISDTVMHVLAQVEGLQVTARTSSFAFKGQNKSIQDIAGALRVAHVLEGSVQSAGDKVRIIARLIAAQTGAEVWSGYYDRSVNSIFDIQDEIAQEVTTALMVKVLHTDDVELVATYQPNLAAFEQLVLGRQALDKDTREGYTEAYQRFEKAIEIDPDYALAYYMLASVTAQNAQRLGLSRSAIVERSLTLVEKALDLDPLLPEGHNGMALSKLALKQFTEAEQSALRAIELRPSYAAAYNTLGWSYSIQRRYEEALVATRKAVELDPEDNELQQHLALALWDLGRAEAANGVLRDAINRHPEIPKNYEILSRQLRQMGKSGEALYWDERVMLMDPGNSSRRFSFCLGLLQTWAIERATHCINEHLAAFPGDPEAINYYAHLTGNTQLGLDSARAAVENNPNFWYRKMQLADWLIRAGEYEETIELFRGSFTPLYEAPPVVDDMTIWAARNLVRAYQALGRDGEANALIEAGLTHLERRRKLQGTSMSTGIDDVVLLTFRGEYDEAINRLEQAIDRGWQFYSYMLAAPMLAMDGLPRELLENPRLQAQVQRLSDIMAKEMADYEARRQADKTG